MHLLSPADLAVSIELEAASHQDDWPDTSIRVVGPDGEPSLIIRTIERTGLRMHETGFVEGVADDVRTMAILAVKEFLLGRIETGLPGDQLSAAMESAEQTAAAVDWADWDFHRMLVDGVGYALRVRRLDHGFAAAADLGLYLITMHGPALPTDLNFTLKRTA